MRTFKDVGPVAVLAGVILFSGLTGCSMWEGKKARETGRTINEYQNDKATTDRVADALKTAPVYKFPAVQVQTFNGDVQLSGFVHTQAQKEEADKIARSIPGVNRVINDLAITPERSTPTGRAQGYPQIEETHKAPVPQPQPAPQPGPANTLPPANNAPNTGPGTQ